jgi:hypothetical protein
MLCLKLRQYGQNQAAAAQFQAKIFKQVRIHRQYRLLNTI